MTASVDPLTVQGKSVFVSPHTPSNYVLARALSANAAESIAVPTGGRYVRLATTVNAYYSHVTTATVPGDTTDGTACELISASGPPEWRYIGGVTTISVISAATCILTASFFTD